jgi:hypothetical protein
MCHWLILNFETEADGTTTDHIVAQGFKEVPRCPVVPMVRSPDDESGT